MAQFTTLNGSGNPGYGLGMVDGTTGASLPFAMNNFVRDGGTDGGITTLASDGTYVYGGGYTYGRAGGTFEGIFSASWNAGEVHFINDCHGDSYSVLPRGDAVYSASHTHYCENIGGVHQGEGAVGSYPYYRGIATGKEPTGTATWEPDQGRYYSYQGQPTPSMLTWFPAINPGSYTGLDQGAWSLAGNDDYVVAGGEFFRVNGQDQQGLVRFAEPAISPNNQRPVALSTRLPAEPHLDEVRQGPDQLDHQRGRRQRLPDLQGLPRRQNGTGLIQTVNLRGHLWDAYGTGFNDTGLVPVRPRYRVAVTDPFGNIANSPWTPSRSLPSGTTAATSRPSRPPSRPTTGASASQRHRLRLAGFRPADGDSGVTTASPAASGRHQHRRALQRR